MDRATSRRQFLKQALAVGGAAGAAMWVPSSILGANAPSNRITLGCIGVGGMGMGNMRNFLGLPDCRVVAVCDAYENRRQEAKRAVDAQYGDTGCAMYGDYRELLARKDIDAVMIATQDHWHALMVVAAAKAGKDIYCEKPLGVSVEEGQRMRDAVRSAKRIFQTGTWQRSQRRFQHACELARNGYLGRIHTVQVSTEGSNFRPKYAGPYDPQPVPAGFDWAMWRGPAPDKPYNAGRVAWPDWYLIWDYCAGFITNWGVHHLDIANWGCPQIGTQPCEIECKATYRKEGFTDNVDFWDATYTYAGGFKMQFTDIKFQKPGTRFIGDEGWFHVDRGGVWAEPASLLKQALKESDLRLTDAKHHQENFLRCIRDRKDPVSDVDSAHQASSLGLLADIAGRLGRKVNWEPAKEQFAGDDEANQMLKRPMHNGWKLVSDPRPTVEQERKA